MLDPSWCQTLWFSIGFTTNTNTCDSKNGKRVRGINTKNNVTALPNKLALCSLTSPLLCRIADTMIKEVVYASAARSLASLGSAQLAPRGGSEELPEKPQRGPGGLQRDHKTAPRKSSKKDPEKLQRDSQRSPQRAQTMPCFETLKGANMYGFLFVLQ